MSDFQKIEEMKQNYHDNLPSPPPRPPKIRQAYQFILAHLFDSQLSINWMKKKCRIYDHNFSSCFFHYVGKKPKKFISHHRIELAKKIFSIEELRNIHITSIALLLGFKSVSSFSIAFKRHTGKTPSQFIQNFN